MPLSDDGVFDIPVLEWCSASDAVIWIMHKRPPVALGHVALAPMPSLSLGFTANGENVRQQAEYLPSWDKLYYAAEQGAVRLRGKPAIGLQKLVPDVVFGRAIQCEKWGEVDDIPVAKLKAATVFAFQNLRDHQFLTDGVFYPTEDFPATAWAYSNVEVNFSQLASYFHSAEAKPFRIGTDIIVVKPDQSSSASPAETNPIKRVGGREPKWDWVGALNATWAAVCAGTIHPDRSDLREFMNAWFAERHEGDCPSVSQIRDMLMKMEEAMKIAAPKTPKS
jgi:hypothetical protein